MVVSQYIRILEAIFLLYTLSNLVCCQIPREQYNSRFGQSFSCRHTSNATISFRNNLYGLLSDFNQRSSSTSYYNTSIGDSPDRVYGYYMCRSDVSHPVCNSCILNGTQFAIEADCEYVDGFHKSEMCIFAYSDHNMYGLREAPISTYDYIEGNVSNHQQFNQTLSTMMDELINEAAFGSQNNNGSTLGFAAMEANVTGDDEVIYSLAQCTPDILGVNCSECLGRGLSSLRREASRAPAGYAIMSKCHVRYDIVPFYNLGEANIGAKLGLGSHLLAINSVVLLLMYYM